MAIVFFRHTQTLRSRLHGISSMTIYDLYTNESESTSKKPILILFTPFKFRHLLHPHSSTMHRMRTVFCVQLIYCVFFASLFSSSTYMYIVYIYTSLSLIIHCWHLRQNEKENTNMQWFKTREKSKENWLLLNSIFTFVYAEIFFSCRFLLIFPFAPTS